MKARHVQTGSQAPTEGWMIALTLGSSLFFLLFPLLEWLPAPGAQPAEITVRASAGELGGFSPNALEVRAGEPLRLAFWAMDVTHSFQLPQIGVDLVLPVGEKVRLTLETGFGENDREYWYVVNQRRFAIPKTPANQTAPPPLVLEFKCNRYCSVQHWSMRGQITVSPPRKPRP